MGYYAADTGDSVAEFEYGPFGDLIRETGSKAGEFNFRFSTKYEDAETGLLYYGFRYYDPVTGRWPSRDPIEERGGLNLYGMVRNNPVNRVDPFGLFSADDAYEHYVFGNGEDIVILFDEVDPGVTTSSFSDFSDEVSTVCSSKSGRNISVREVIDTGSTNPAGNLTFFLDGTLSYNHDTCDWEFEGTVTAPDRERYDFNRTWGDGNPNNNRNIPNEIATWTGWIGGQVGRVFGGSGGTPFWINYVGSKDLSESGSCSQ